MPLLPLMPTEKCHRVLQTNDLTPSIGLLTSGSRHRSEQALTGLDVQIIWPRVPTDSSPECSWLMSLHAASSIPLSRMAAQIQTHPENDELLLSRANLPELPARSLIMMLLIYLTKWKQTLNGEWEMSWDYQAMSILLGNKLELDLENGFWDTLAIVRARTRMIFIPTD